MAAIEFLDIVKSNASKYAHLSNQIDVNESEDVTEAAKRSKNTFVLSDNINQVIAKMEREKREDASKRIPDGFIKFARDPMFRDLLESMLDYCRELFRLENKQQVLEQEAKSRGLPIPQVLPSEKKKLYEKAKKMADKYSWIVFKHRSIGGSVG